MSNDNIDIGAPLANLVPQKTNAVLLALGDCDLETALTVLCSILGHCVAAMSEQKPSLVQKYGTAVAENVKKAAIAKLLHEDAQRRNKQ